MRADDDEVKWFYDLLGWAIVDARAKAGDEDFLAFLCNARTLFCKVYDFLDSEDDLKKVKERIDVVKEQLAQGYDVFGNNTKQPGHSPGATRNRKIIKTPNNKIINGEMEKTPEIILEDLLMLADWKLKQRDYKKAETNYFMVSRIATGTFANIEYDGTTMENAANLGMIKCNLINKKSKIKKLQINDGSYRAAELTLQLYLVATNDEQRAEYDTESAMKILPEANNMELAYLINHFNNLCEKKHFENALKVSSNYYTFAGTYPISFGMRVSAFYASLGDTKSAFSAALQSLIMHKPNVKYLSLIPIEVWCDNNWSWASSNDLEKYKKAKLGLVCISILNRHSGGISISKINRAIMICNIFINEEKR